MGEQVEVRVDQDEWWVWAPVADDEYRRGTVTTLAVDKSAARRWKAAVKAFNAMAQEISGLVRAQEAAQKAQVDDDEG